MRPLKKISFLIMMMILVFSGLVKGSNSFVFSVSSNPSINIGYKIGSFILYGGTDLSYTKTETESEISASPIYLRKNGYSVFIAEPALGMKFFLLQKEISPFLIGNITKEIPFIIESSGINSESEIKDQYDDYKLNFGAGVDFSIKETLSLGFELGISYFYSDWDMGTLEHTNVHLFSFSRVTLNWYFI